MEYPKDPDNCELFCEALRYSDAVTREEVRARICELGIVPAIRVTTAEDALFAAESVSRGGIPIVEVTMTVPGALAVVAEILRTQPEMIVGAGTILDIDTAESCVDAGVHFLTSPGLHRSVMEVATRTNTAVLPGALTPTEICAAWQSGADFVKVFPCAPVGGPSYIKSMRGPFPAVRFLAAGGVNQQTAGDYILAGAAALGIGGDLIPSTAIHERNRDWIQELAHRFLGIVKTARAKRASREPQPVLVER
jgi:2-dehydro-3-deoxyphosphogluconate aldolase/(4S)-4-hydroxy-2-oxoglutarate aldolase